MTKQINIRLNDDLYEAVKQKCHDRFGVGISPFIKVFLKAFVTQKSVGFWVGDAQLDSLFRSWLRNKSFDKIRGKREGDQGGLPPYNKLFEL